MQTVQNQVAVTPLQGRDEDRGHFGDDDPGSALGAALGHEVVVIAPGEENTPTRFASASAADFRADAARDRREMMRPQWGDAIDQFSDADMIDAIFYSVFPNLHPWADFNPIFYRFRPDGNNPEQSLHEVMYMVQVPEGAERPAPAKVTSRSEVAPSAAKTGRAEW